ncbi:hypothetical protein D3C75_593530 [compost metagenome]
MELQTIGQVSKDYGISTRMLTRFVEEINEKADVNLKLLSDEAVFSVISSLSFSDNQIKETKENLSMEELNKANEELMKMEDKDVRQNVAKIQLDMRRGCLFPITWRYQHR